MNQYKLDNVLALNSTERQDYLLRKVADFEAIYLINDLNGKSIRIASNDVEAIPVWPEQEFAERFLVGDWIDYKIVEYDIYDFMGWLSELAKQGTHIDVFPNHEFESVKVPADEMKSNLRSELSQYE